MNNFEIEITELLERYGVSITGDSISNIVFKTKEGDEISLQSLIKLSEHLKKEK